MNRQSTQSVNRLEAMSHPVRRKALRILVERLASPSEIADELDLPTANVAFHVNRLVELDCARLIEERPARGAIQHMYRATELALISTQEWERLHPAEMQAFVAEIMQKILDDFRISAAADIVGRDTDFHLTRTPLALDLDGLREGVALMEDFRLELAELAAGSEQRKKEESAELFPVSSSFALFRMPDHPAEGDTKPTKISTRSTQVDNRLTAMSHLVRREVLRILVERLASPSEIANELDLPTANITHHVKQLVKLDCARLIEKRPVQGAIQNMFRATELALVSTEEWEQLHPAEKQAFVAEIMQKILDDFLASEAAEIVGRDTDFHLTRTPLALDLDGLREGVALMEDFRLELADLAARSEQRGQEEGAKILSVSSSLALFKMPYGKSVLTD